MLEAEILHAYLGTPIDAYNAASRRSALPNLLYNFVSYKNTPFFSLSCGSTVIWWHSYANVWLEMSLSFYYRVFHPIEIQLHKIIYEHWPFSLGLPKNFLEKLFRRKLSQLFFIEVSDKVYCIWCSVISFTWSVQR